MVERITSIEMQAFRGIRGTFALDLANGRSCVVLGDNATGKSTITDAIEWYFTGEIYFLSKEGRGDAIRHSGVAKDVDTKVTVFTDGSLGGEITTSESSRSTVTEVGCSELFLLRGHTLADFINKTKGEKWQALAKLLGLEAIDGLRRDLQHVRNELEGAAQSARTDLEQKRSGLSQRIGEVSDAGILEAFKQRCAVAEIEPPGSLDRALDPQWLRAMLPEGSPDQRAAALRAALTELRTAAEQPVRLDPIVDWNQFVAEAEIAGRLRSEMYVAAKSLIEDGHVEEGKCPLCHQPMDLSALAARITGELKSMESAARALEDAQKRARQFVSLLNGAHRSRREARTRVLQHNVQLVELPAIPVDALNRAVDEVQVMGTKAVEDYVHAVESWDQQAIEALDAAIPAPATGRDQALVEIGVLHSESTAWRNAIRRHGEAMAAYELAERVFSRYQQRQHEHFQEVMEHISGRMAEIYMFLHPEGGIGAAVVETVGEKGAELSVEFHGKKELPPHRVLSESHLNSLGVALFLAMAKTFNEQIGFLVLDDVVNSFDREHRGRLAELLADKFEDTQLIVLTHDEQFFTHLCQHAPSWLFDHFTSWSYQDGPRTKRYVSDRLLQEAEEQLAGGNRRGAAQMTRVALEDFLQEACERLKALLPFRRGQANDQRMADEVIKGLRRTLKDRARALYSELGRLLTALEADLQAVLNIESHASQVSASNQEVRDALARVVELRERFTCNDCRTLVWHKGTPDAARCKCGRAQFPPVSEDSGGGR